jgi:TonB family protein
MSAAPSLAFEKTPQRVFPRHPIGIPVDLIALRSGVPENMPGRCTDLSEAGLGAVIAGELSAGQQVAVELRLPNVGVPVRVRALIRYQSKLHCGMEFVALSASQREMIRYWLYCSTSHVAYSGGVRKSAQITSAKQEKAPPVAAATGTPRRGIRMGRLRGFLLLLCILALAGLGWWQWQRSWKELENGTAAQTGWRVPAETMERRILSRPEPLYPEAARSAGTEGLVVLDATIGPDGRIKRLWPVSGPDVLAQSAAHAVQSWTFEPYLASGQPVEVETTIAVEFRLN